jgi:hypothetical protein
MTFGRTQRAVPHFAAMALATQLAACGDDTETIDTSAGATTGEDSVDGPDTNGATTASTASDDDWEPPSGSDDGLSDEFDDPSSLDSWTRREDAEGGEGYWEVLEIANGRLRLRPTASGWYGNFMGPMLFKTIEGDFVVQTAVRAASLGDPETAPSQLFNSGGLIVRDPGSRDGAQQWITHNVGRQQPEVGSEGKDTRDSESLLELVDGPHYGTLRICRFGSTFVLARRLGNESDFREMHRFERGDLPDAVQVGIMANGWNSADAQPNTSISPDVEVSFDHVRFWQPQTEADCLVQ